jgi:hypothetical protein
MRVWILAVSLASLVATFWPTNARACSCMHDFVRTIPTRLESGVPRNQAIVLEGRLQPDTIALLNRDGRPHAFSTRATRQVTPCSVWSIELIPTPALEPNAHYELRFARTQPDEPGKSPLVSVRFSTSSELLPDPELAPPTGTLKLIEAPKNFSNSCGTVAGFACLRVDDPTDVEVVVRDGDTILMRSPLRQAEWRFDLWNKLPTCIELVRRAKTGRRSKPLSFCGKDLAPQPWVDGRECSH